MAAINELYLVQISGSLGASSLLKTNCSSSFVKMMLIARDAAAEVAHKAAYIQHHIHRIARAITGSATKSKQKEREGKYLPPMPSLLTRK
jgi:hypothetical protein